MSAMGKRLDKREHGGDGQPLSQAFLAGLHQGDLDLHAANISLNSKMEILASLLLSQLFSFGETLLTRSLE